MITLKKACKLLNLTDGDIVFFSLIKNRGKICQSMTYREIVNKLDMKDVKVLHIDIKFSYYGDVLGYILEVNHL